MRLYHGSNQPIEKIDLTKGKKFKDFGQGFYTTHLKQQATEWSKTVTDRYGGTPTVMEYEFDLEKAKAAGLNIKIFENADREWALFVMANRNRKRQDYRHNYDIVIGPVADDDMARLFGLFDMAIIDLEAVVAGLKYKKLNSQYFFATERALKFLIEIKDGK